MSFDVHSEPTGTGRTGTGKTTRSLAIAALAAIPTLLALASTADAGGRHLRISRDIGYNGLGEGYVVAHSRHGNGSVSGPVRVARLGPQVRLPGGTWEYCRRSCSETLRVETVDFWEGRNSGSSGLAQECGIFGCLGIHLGY
jgi:hypothetical protein